MSEQILDLNQSRSKISKISIILAFLMLFIYGALLLMIGYTQKGLEQVIFNPLTDSEKLNADKNMFYLLVPQSVGLILAAIIVGKLIAKFNIRWIFLTGFSVAAVSLIVISQFNHFSNLSQSARIIIFIIMSLLFGTAIGPMSPLVSTLFGAVYTGSKRTKMLSVSNGVYGVGAGFIPLVISPTVASFKEATSSSDFTHVQIFYYIAFALAIVGAGCGYLINYLHPRQLTSSKSISIEKNFNIWKPLIMALALMSAYMITETIVNYAFQKSTNRSLSDITSDSSKYATMAFGLFVTVQGLFRAFTGLVLANKIKSWTFIFISAIVMAFGLIWALLGGLGNIWSAFLIAIVLGVGVGNLWPMIYTYSVDIDENRASFIGVAINIISMFWIPVTQVLIAIIWNSEASSKSISFLAPILIAFITSVLVIALIIYSYFYFRKIKIIQNAKENTFISFRK